MPGSIRKRGKHSYQIRFNLPPGPSGARRQYAETVHGSKRDAEKRLACLVADLVQNGYRQENKKTVKEYMEEWLRKYKQDHRASTYDVTEGLVRNHIVKAFGDTPLASLTPVQVNNLIVDMLHSGLSSRTARYVHWILKRALREAVDMDLVRRNVAEKVKPPRDLTKETQPLTEEQVGAFFREAKSSRLCAAFVVLLCTGLRRGELLALTWEDIDFDRMVLYVRRALVKAKGKTVITEGKTENSKRVIPLSPTVMEVLRRHKLRQAEERLRAGHRWQERGFVFTNKWGGPIYPDNFTSRYLKPVLKRAGLEGIHPHRFRHTFATWCVANGVDIKQVCEWMGHYDEAFTWKKYHHLMPGRSAQDDAKVLDRVVFGNVSGQLVDNCGR